MIMLRGTKAHLFHYARWRYKRSTDIFYDLAKIIRQTTDVEEVPLSDVFEKVFDLFGDLLTLDQQRTFWLNVIEEKMFLAIDGKYKIDVGDIIKHMLYYLTFAEIDDMDGNVLIRLAEEPDYSILPEAKD